MVEVTPVYLSRSISSHTPYLSKKEFTIIETSELIKPKAQFFSFKQYLNSDNRCYLVQDILVKPESSTSSVHINSFFIQNGSLIFYNCTFDCDISINLNQCKHISFINCKLNNNFSFKSKIAGNLFFFNTTIFGDTKFEKNSQVSSSIIFEKSTFSDIKFMDTFNATELLIHKRTKIKHSILFENTSIDTIKVDNDVDIRGNFNKYWNISHQKPAKNATIFISTTTVGGFLNLFGYHLEQVLIEQVIIDKISITSCKIKNLVITGENGFNHLHIGAEINNLKFEKTKIYGQLSIGENSKIEVLHIYSSEIEQDILIRSSEISLLEINEKSILRGLRIDNTKLLNSQFESVEFKGLVWIDSNSTEVLNIYNCCVYDNFHFISSNKATSNDTMLHLSCFFVEDSCSITETNFNNFHIDNTIIGKILSLSKVVVNNNFSLNKVLCSYSLRVDYFSKFNSLEFNQLYTGFLDIENSIVNSNKIVFYDCHFDKLYHYDLPKYEFLFERCKINTIEFTQKTNPKDNIYTFIMCSFYQLKISNFNNLGNLFFRTINAKIINNHSDNFRKNLLNIIQNNDLTEFKIEEEYEKYVNWDYTLPEKSSVIFSQSSLGKAEFTDFDFAGFDFYYNNSKITEIFVSGGTLPQTIEISNVEKKTTDYYIQKVGVYNQFKKIFDSQGDNFQSTYFQAKAAENQAELLEQQRIAIIKKEQKSATNWLSKISIWVKVSAFSHNTFEKLTFWLNKKSNRHGESWIQALKFIFFISTILFFIYCWVSGKYHLESTLSWKNFGNTLGDYVSFLDPTQKIKDDISGWSKTVLFVSKIFIGYGIFQLIAAFRKHGKKSG